MWGINVRMLTGIYAASISNRDYYVDSNPEYPPHPARVNRALVDSLHRGGNRPDEREALLFIEKFGAPSIYASEASCCRAVFYVANDGPTSDPPEDGGLWDREEVVGKNFKHINPLNRGKTPRPFPYAIPKDPNFQMIYPGEIGMHRKALDRLLGRLDHLGQKTSGAIFSIVTGDAIRQPTYVPGKGEFDLRVPYEGSLARLEELYAAQQGSRAYLIPKESRTISYMKVDGPLPVPSNWNWLGFGPVCITPKFPLERSLLLTRCIRDILMKHCQEIMGNVPTFISGHAEDGGMDTAKMHLAIVPCANVGFEHSDGHILGVGFLSPAAADPDAKEIAEQVIASVIGSGKEFETELGKIKLGFEEKTPEALQKRRWSKPSRRFCSVTPIALNRWPKRGPAGPTVRDIVFSQVAAAGLPIPTKLLIQYDAKEPGGKPLMGVPPCMSFGLTCDTKVPKPGDKRVPLWHIVVEFDRYVCGPVLIGKGLFHGQGLLLPWTK